MEHVTLGLPAKLSFESVVTDASEQSVGRLRVSLEATALTQVRWPVMVTAAFEQDGRVLAGATSNKLLFVGQEDTGATRRIDDWTLELPLSRSAGLLTVRFELHGADVVGDAPTLTVQSDAPPRPDGFPVCEIKTVDGRACMFVNGERVSPTQGLFLRPDPLQLRNAVDTGIEVWQVWLHEAGFYPDGFDFTEVDQKISAYLQAKPDAWLIVSTMFDGRYHGWWLKAHPETHAQLGNGSTAVGGYHGAKGAFPSNCSDEWRQAYGELLRRLVRHMRSAPYASRIVGIQPCAGISAEWFHWGSQSGDLIDYSEAAQTDFRRWLRDTYATDAGLGAAWSDDGATFDTVRVPSDEQRRTPVHGMFFDPATQRDVLDYNRYQHDVVADAISALYRIVKDESGGRLICGTYYGYVMYLPESKGFSQGSGQFSLYRQFAGGLMDYCIAPTGYDNRNVGQAPTSMSVVESFALNGTMWLDQADLRSHWAEAGYGAPTNLTGSIQAMRRETARALAQGTALQWYDFSNGWTFGDERLTDEMTRLERILRTRDETPDWPRSQYLAVIVDEQQVGTFDPFNPPYDSRLINRQREQLARAGVPWRAYLFSDLIARPELLDHRAFLLLNLFRLTQAHRAYLRNTLMKDGRTVAFVGPVGLIDETGFSATHGSAILGWPMREVLEETALSATFAADLPEPWTACSGMTIGTSVAFAPVLLPTPPAASVLAMLGTSDQPAVLFERRADVSLFWSAAPGLPPEVLRSLAETAGVAVISRDNHAIYAGRGYVGIHSAASVDGTLRLPYPAAVRELIGGQTWPAGTREVTLELIPGDTRILQCFPR